MTSFFNSGNQPRLASSGSGTQRESVSPTLNIVQEDVGLPQGEVIPDESRELTLPWVQVWSRSLLFVHRIQRCYYRILLAFRVCQPCLELDSKKQRLSTSVYSWSGWAVQNMDVNCMDYLCSFWSIWMKFPRCMSRPIYLPIILWCLLRIILSRRHEEWIGHEVFRVFISVCNIYFHCGTNQ